MKFLHCMIRVSNLDQSLHFWVDLLGFHLVERRDYESGRFSLLFLQLGDNETQLELTYNWDQEEPYTSGRNFGHLALEVENIYETCQRLMDDGVVINRPPRDGHMAFVRSPDQISVEFLQNGRLEPAEPWASMSNTGEW